MICLKSHFPINSIFVCYNEVIPKSIIDSDNNCQVKLLASIGHMILWMGHMIAHIGHMIKEINHMIKDMDYMIMLVIWSRR